MWLVVLLVVSSVAGKRSRAEEQRQCVENARLAMQARQASDVAEQREAERRRQETELARLQAEADACEAGGREPLSACRLSITTFLHQERGLMIVVPEGRYDVAACGTILRSPAASLPVGDPMALWRPPGPILRPKDAVDAHSAMAVTAHSKRVQALDFIRGISNAAVDQRAELLYRYADVHLEEARYQLAIGGESARRHLESAAKVSASVVSQYPGYQRLDHVIHNLATALDALEQWDKAAELWTRLIQQYPASRLLGEALLNLGDHHYQNGRPYQALVAYKKAQTKSVGSDRVYALYRSAWCHHQLGNLAEAARTMDEVATTPIESVLMETVVQAAGRDRERWAAE